MNLQEAINWFGGTEIANYLKELKQLREEKRATGFENAYDRGYETGRLKGQDEAWEAARKIALGPPDGGMNYIECQEAFGMDEAEAMRRLTAAEAIAKIKAWEESKAIHVGDVVECLDASKGAVVNILPKKNMARVLFETGSSDLFGISELYKTGRSVDVEGFLKQIGGGSD